MNPWLRWGVAVALGLAVPSLAPRPLGAQLPPEDFGRWQTAVRSCRLAVPQQRPKPYACDGVRLDQQLPGLLSVRFLQRSAGPGVATRLLMFAGILEPGSPAMRCGAGDCQRQGRMRTQVSAMADLGFEPVGAASGLPRTRLVQGRCLVESQRVRCDATADGDQRWWAEAEL